MPRISRDADIYPITMRELEVLRVEDITPGMRRIVFGGAGLKAHTRDGGDVPAIVSDGFDDDMRMIFPDPETGERPYPVSLGDGRLDWTPEVNDLFRTYTVRRWEPDAGEYGELTVDFARHGAGLAEGWSSTVSAGDLVYAAGPKNCGSLPVHTDWLLLIGDETALPAIGRCLEEVPAGHRVTAVVEVPTRADIQDELSHVACADTLDLRWLVRDEGDDFTAEVRRLESDGPLPDGTPFVWAGGEAGRLKAVRAVVKSLGIPREHVQVTGYWRRNGAPAATGDGDSGTAAVSSNSALWQLHELTEIEPGLALQAAARLRLFEVIDSTDGAAAVAAVARETGVDADRLVRFLRYLDSVGLVVVGEGAGESAGTVRLTALGSELADPDGLVARLTGPEAQQALAWLHLDDVLRTGDTVGEALDTPVMRESLADTEATRAQWVAPALAARLGQLPGGEPSSVAVVGAGQGVAAAVYADELLRSNDSLTVSVLDLPDGCGEDRLLREVGASRRDRVDVRSWNAAGDAVDVVLLVDPFALAAPDHVAGLLGQAASHGAPDGRIVLVTRLLAERGDEDHDYGEDLTRMLTAGRSLPTARDLSRVVAGAGLEGVADVPVGWGSRAVVLRTTQVV